MVRRAALFFDDKALGGTLKMIHTTTASELDGEAEHNSATGHTSAPWR